MPEVEPLKRNIKLALEREVMGVYVSDHPLRGLERILAKKAKQKCSQLDEFDDGATVELAGVISSTRNILTKTNKKMMTATLEDFSGIANLFIFAGTLEKHSDVLVKDKVVTLK
ncbi:MAG: hypothetical protein NTU72_03235 [Fimbriimonadales bacterium]|nr:hypothetical protein [Fimbriimonadales bacterium]